MSWVKLDDHTNEHVKMLVAGAEAAWLWACGLMYCNRQKKRDGVIPADMVSSLYAKFSVRRSRSLACDLVKCGLWEEITGGFRVHDYHDYQPTEEALADLRAKRKAAGSKGGKAKAERAAASKASSKVPQACRAGSGDQDLLSGSLGGAGGVVLPFRRPGDEEDDVVDRLSDDGYMVDAWLDEVRQRTGVAVWIRPCQAKGNLNNLAAALGAMLEPASDRCAGARALAAEYVASVKEAGGKLAILNFIDWLANGKTAVKKAGRRPEEDPTDAELSMREEQQRKRAAPRGG